MKFEQKYGHLCNFPYGVMKRTVMKANSSEFVNRVIAEIGKLPELGYEMASLEYLAIIKCIKKYEKKNECKVFSMIEDSIRGSRLWKTYGVRLQNDFDQRYPQYSCIHTENIPLIAHRGLNLSSTDLRSMTMRNTHDHIELDVCMSKSGVVVHHDIVLPSGMRVADVDAKEYDLVVFDDVMRKLGKECKHPRLYIDVKGVSTVALLLLEVIHFSFS